MRVLALIDTVTVSGPGRQLVEGARALATLGVEVTIGLFERRGAPPRPYAAFVQESGVPSVVFRERGALDRSVVNAVDAYISRAAPDLVQTHGYKPSAVAWMLKRRANRQPWIAFFHGATTENLKVRAYHHLDQWLMRSADAVVLMSALHARALSSRFRRSHVIHNAVLFPPSPNFHAPPARRIPARLLVVGRLSSEKGVDILLQACAQLRNRQRPVELTVLGDGPDRESLQALANGLQLDAVRFVGHSAIPAPFYDEADLLVIPSRSEGLPNVLLEAISHGLPVAATSVGAIPEVLTDDCIGHVCPPGNSVALANAIEACLADGFREAGIAGRERVLHDFSVSQRAERLLRLYRDTQGACSVASRATRSS